MKKFYKKVYHLYQSERDCIRWDTFRKYDEDTIFIYCHPAYELYETFICVDSEYRFIGYIPYNIISLITVENLRDFREEYFPNFDLLSEVRRYNDVRIDNCIEARKHSDKTFEINSILQL